MCRPKLEVPSELHRFCVLIDASPVTFKTCLASVIRVHAHRIRVEG
jgi:hypothetical protein